MDLCDAWFPPSKRILGLIQVTEDFVRLNVHEIGVILSALQQLDLSEENQIAREYGSVPALYAKLYKVFDQMDRSGTVLRNDVVPSF